MAEYSVEVLPPDSPYDTTPILVAWLPNAIPVQPYIEYRDSRPVGQLWPRGGLPEGNDEGPQTT